MPNDVTFYMLARMFKNMAEIPQIIFKIMYINIMFVLIACAIMEIS